MARKKRRYQFIVEGQVVVKATNYREALLAVVSSLTGVGLPSDASVETGFVPRRTGQLGKCWRKGLQRGLGLDGF